MVLKKKKKLGKKPVRVITPIGRVSYPYLSEPDSGRSESDDKYKVDLFIPISEFKTEAGKALKAKVLAVGRKFFNDDALELSDFKNPLQNVAKLSEKQRAKLPKDVQEGYIRLRAKSDFKPILIGPDKEDLSDKEVEAIQGGDFMRIGVSIFGYPQQDGGVALGLNIVQFAKKGKPFGQGKAEALKMFDELEVEMEDPDEEEEESDEDAPKKKKKKAREEEDETDDADDSGEDEETDSDGTEEDESEDDSDDEEEEAPRKKKKSRKSDDADDDDF